MIEESIASRTESFFDRYLSESNFGECSLFLCRKDGGVLYKHGPIVGEIDPDSICVLMSGAWQAAETVSTMASREKKLEGFFRFSFDTSSSGIHILPLDINSKKYYLGAIFYNQKNPAILKNELKKILFSFQNEILSFDEQEDAEKQSLLFGNITDKEMNDIFTFNE